MVVAPPPHSNSFECNYFMVSQLRVNEMKRKNGIYLFVYSHSLSYDLVRWFSYLCHCFVPVFFGHFLPMSLVKL